MAFHPRVITDGGFQHGGPRPAAHAADAHAIGAGIFEVDGGEIGHAIGRDVVARVADFVEKLLFHAVRIDAPAGAGVLGDGERSVGLGFHDGIADVGQIRNVLPIHLAIAAGALRAAFDDVPGDGAGGQLVVIVGLPAESWIMGASARAVSVQRPAMTTSAPVASASASGNAPM